MTCPIQQIDDSCDVIEWVREVILPRVKRSADNTHYVFPDPLVHLQEFSHAHSWYKHLRERPGKFYPMLRQGEVDDPTILSSKRKRADDLQSLYWSFVTEDSLFETDWQGGSKFSQGPVSLFKLHSFYASDELSCFSLTSFTPHHASEFLAKCVLIECEKLCDIVVRILLSIDPNPPVGQLLLFQSALDKYENEDDQGVCISNRFYKWYFHEDVSWTLHTDGFTVRANSTLYNDLASPIIEKNDVTTDVQELPVKKEIKIHPTEEQQE
jgi:hypothetical protein